MAGFSPYDDEVSVEGVENGRVLIGVQGSQSYRSGEYTNERNTTQTVPVEPETAEEIAAALEHHAWALKEGAKGQMVRKMETKPGKQVVAFDDDGRRHVLGSEPALYVEEK